MHLESRLNLFIDKVKKNIEPVNIKHSYTLVDKGQTINTAVYLTDGIVYVFEKYNNDLEETIVDRIEGPCIVGGGYLVTNATSEYKLVIKENSKVIFINRTMVNDFFNRNATDIDILAIAR